MKTIIAIVLMAMLVAAAYAAAPGVETGKDWESSYEHLKMNRAGLAQVDKIILSVLNEMTKEQNLLRSHVAKALNERNKADEKRRGQVGLVNKLRGERINAEGQYNAKRAEEQKAVNQLEVLEKLHRESMETYQKTHAENSEMISKLDREKNILTEIRRLLGSNRVSRYQEHSDQADIDKAKKHEFENYKDEKSKFHHGEQRFHGHWTKVSTVETETKELLGVNLKGVTNDMKAVKLVNTGTVLDWLRGNEKTWTSYGFDLRKIVFRVMDKKTEKISYISVEEPYHRCGLEKLAETREDFKVDPSLMQSKSGAVTTCYKANEKVNNCWNQIVLNTEQYQPLSILEIESLGKCYTADNALRFKFDVYGLL